MCSFVRGDSTGLISVWQVPLEADKENLRKIVKAFSEKQGNTTSSVECRIAALESAAFMALSTSEDVDQSGNALKPCTVYSFDDVLKASGRSNQNECRNLSLKLEARGHSGLVSSLSFNANGKFLATGCSDGLINIWSIEVIIYCYSSELIYTLYGKTNRAFFRICNVHLAQR